MVDIYSMIGRTNPLFKKDIEKHQFLLKNEIEKSRFLVLGGAGSIGQAVVKEIFKRNPLKLHVVDLSENNMVELVRDLRSSCGYIPGDFKTYVLDIGSIEYDAFINGDGNYDYVLNLSALKHVRSERDPFTLMRMIDVNILNTDKTIRQSIDKKVKKYFCVSTDKAANPVNMMGASKRIMEMFLMRRSEKIKISTARFANVAFSDGSLLHGFNKRIDKHQPIAAPNDIRRYFVTPQESGELCLMSCIFGENRDIFFPKLSADLNLITFSEIAINFLKSKNLVPVLCKTEQEARDCFVSLKNKKKWPCLFLPSNTTGEKDFEEFYTDNEVLDMESYISLGVIKNKPEYQQDLLEFFEKEISSFKNKGSWNKKELIDLFNIMLPNFQHKEVGNNLDNKM